MSHSVHIGTLQSARSQMETSTAEIERIITRLNEEIRPLMNSWRGAATTSYSQVQEDWMRAVAGMKEQLGNAQRALGSIEKNYVGTDDKLAFEWSEIR